MVEGGGHVALVDLADGQQLASYPAAGVRPALGEETALFADGDTLVAVDAVTGREEARATTGPVSTVVATGDATSIVTLAPPRRRAHRG